MKSRVITYLFLMLLLVACSAQKSENAINQVNFINSIIASDGSRLSYTNIKVIEDDKFEVTCKNGTTEIISNLEELKNADICNRPIVIEKSSSFYQIGSSSFCYFDKDSNAGTCWGRNKIKMNFDEPVVAVSKNIELCVISREKLKCEKGQEQQYYEKFKDLPSTFQGAHALVIASDYLCILDPVLKCWGTNERVLNLAKSAPVGNKLVVDGETLYVLTPIGILNSGNPNSQNNPPLVPTKRPLDLVLDRFNSCFVTVDNGLECKFGSKTERHKSSAELKSELLKDDKLLLQVALSGDYICARTDVAVRCANIGYSSRSLQVPTLRNPTFLGGGYDGVFCAKNDDGLTCWGTRSVNSLKKKAKYTDIAIPGDSELLCAFSEMGEEQCWGYLQTDPFAWNTLAAAGAMTNLKNPEIMVSKLKSGSDRSYRCTADQEKILCEESFTGRSLEIMNPFKQKITGLSLWFETDKTSKNDVNLCVSSAEGLACNSLKFLGENKNKGRANLQLIKDSPPVRKFVEYAGFNEVLFLTEAGQVLKFDWSTFSIQPYDLKNRVDYNQGPLQDYWNDGYIQNNQYKSVRYSLGTLPTSFLEGAEGIINVVRMFPAKGKAYLVHKNDATVELWQTPSLMDDTPYSLMQTFSNVKKVAYGPRLACLLMKSGYVECIGSAKEEIDGFNGLEQDPVAP